MKADLLAAVVQTAVSLKVRFFGLNLVSIGGCGSFASRDLSIVGSNPTGGPFLFLP